MRSSYLMSIEFSGFQEGNIPGGLLHINVNIFNTMEL